jgi:hypothetical protein
MIALLKYGTGFPFNRQRRLGRCLGIPLPASTAWELVAAAAQSLMPVWEELIWQAAQGEIVYNDDTNMKIVCFVRWPGESYSVFVQSLGCVDSVSTSGECSNQQQHR